MSTRRVMMDSIDTVKDVAKLIEHLKEFVNETSVPRCLTVNATELEFLVLNVITPLIWSECIRPHLVFAVSVKPGSSLGMRLWTISIRSLKGARTLGEMFNLSTSAVTSGRVPSSTTNINKSNTPKGEDNGRS